MQRIIQLWKSSAAGKLIIGCGGFTGLLLICGVCGVLFSQAPAGQAIPTPDISAVQTQAAHDFAATLTAEAPSATPTPRLPTPTPTLVPPAPSDTPTPTLTPTPTWTPTSSPTPSPIEGQVTKVIDGDTIEVNLGGRIYRVRYIGMNTPEVGQLCADEATARNAELVGGKMVTLVKDISETDKYGRLLRYVYVGDIFVNAQLVKDGYAQAATYPPDVAFADLFVQSEGEAREAQRGCWAPSGVPATPTLPPGTGWNCSGNLYNCDDFSSCDQVMSYWHACPGDPSRLDGDHDGRPCEALCR
jgi:micrococcal nuclease